MAPKARAHEIIFRVPKSAEGWVYAEPLQPGKSVSLAVQYSDGQDFVAQCLIILIYRLSDPGSSEW